MGQDDDLLSGEEDDENFVLESSRLLGENESLASLLKKLQKPWINPRAPLPENHFEGWLWKKKRRTTGWSRVYCILDGYQFTWKKDPSARKVKGSVAICFLAKKETPQFAVALIESNKLSKFCVDLYSPHTVLTLLSEEEAILETWHDQIKGIIQKNMSREEYATREQVVKSLQPLLTQKSEEEVYKLFRALMIIEQNGIFVETKLSRKDKGGRLEMWLEDRNEWTNGYFALFDSVLFYYKRAKTPPQAFIILRKAEIKLLGESSAEPFLSQEDPRCQFEINTPIQTFKLRAKHDVAAEDWVSTLNRAKEGKVAQKDRILDGPQFTNLVDLDDDSDNVGAQRRLSYRTGSSGQRKLQPKNFFHFPIGGGPFTVTIGRSSSNKIAIDEDRKLSREHAKIETLDGKVYVFYDLGSSRGSKINKVPVTKQVLRHRDIIKIGKTVMKFKVKKAR